MALVLLVGVLLNRYSAYGQSSDEQAVLSGMLERGRDQTQAKRDAHHLFDVIGPRLTASPADLAAHNWLRGVYQEMGLEAWNETYAKLPGWRRGPTHADLIFPRVRTLEALAAGWSPATRGPVEATVVTFPAMNTPEEFRKWLTTVRGSFVMASAPDSTCRPIENWQAFAKPEAVDRMDAERKKVYEDWAASFKKIGVESKDFPKKVEEAGASGIFVKTWLKDLPIPQPRDAWGASVIMDAGSERVPMLNLSCEDYGLVWRLAESGDHPRVRVSVDSQFLGASPVENTFAKIPGTEHPEETIILSAHLDSWDAASGATDNGTGTLKMLEAMRILRDLYPKPRRTILVRHWSGEEQGLADPHAVSGDLKKIAAGIQLVLEQDVGTGRAASLLPLSNVPETDHALESFIRQLPVEIGGGLTVQGMSESGASGPEPCNGFAVVELYTVDKTKGNSPESMKGFTWSYSPYTHHTNLDTYDKVIFEEVQFDATLAAMLAYEAAERPEPMPCVGPAVKDR
jgi:hypothetical protein